MWNLSERSFLVEMVRWASATHDRKHVDSDLEDDQRCHHFLPQFVVGSETAGSSLCPAAPGGLPAVAVRMAQFRPALQRRELHQRIHTLSDMTHNWGIAILSDLDNQVSSLFNRSTQLLLDKASKIFRSSRLQSAQLYHESFQSQLGVFCSFYVNRQPANL